MTKRQAYDLPEEPDRPAIADGDNPDDALNSVLGPFRDRLLAGYRGLAAQEALGKPGP